MFKLGDRKGSLVGNVTKLAEYVAAGGAGGYFLGRYPEKQHFSVMGHGVPTIPAVAVGAKALSLGLTHFRVGGILGKAKPYLDVLGNAWLVVYAASYLTSIGGKASGRVSAVISQGDVAKLRAAVPGATILGVSEQAPTGRALNAQDIEAIVRSIK